MALRPCALDWEDSVVGAAEAEFQKRGYTCRREIGSRADLCLLRREPSLDSLVPGTNLRDLWTLKRDGKDVDLWILEAKGKQAAPFEHYNVACALGQVFQGPKELLNRMLGKRLSAVGNTPGDCWRFAQELHQCWDNLGFRPTITVGVLVPEWSPDVVWNGQARRQEESYFAKPLKDFRTFLNDGSAVRGGSVKRRAFGEMLEGLEKDVQIRELERARDGLRFRLLTPQQAPEPHFFRLAGAFE